MHHKPNGRTNHRWADTKYPQHASLQYPAHGGPAAAGWAVPPAVAEQIQAQQQELCMIRAQCERLTEENQCQQHLIDDLRDKLAETQGLQKSAIDELYEERQKHGAMRWEASEWKEKHKEASALCTRLTETIGETRENAKQQATLHSLATHQLKEERDSAYARGFKAGADSQGQVYRDEIAGVRRNGKAEMDKRLSELNSLVQADDARKAELYRKLREQQDKLILMKDKIEQTQELRNRVDRHVFRLPPSMVEEGTSTLDDPCPLARLISTGTLGTIDQLFAQPDPIGETLGRPVTPPDSDGEEWEGASSDSSLVVVESNEEPDQVEVISTVEGHRKWVKEYFAQCAEQNSVATA